MPLITAPCKLRDVFIDKNFFAHQSAKKTPVNEAFSTI